jgi:hypothetical protein
MPPLALPERDFHVRNEIQADFREASAVCSQVNSFTGLVRVRSRVVAELTDWRATPAVLVAPSGDNRALTVLDGREERDFALYYLGSSCL